MDKICREHFTRLADMDEAVRLGVETGREHDKLRHTCIVKSTPSRALLNVKDWDAPLKISLDELDTVSLELHRAYKRLADKVRDTEPLFGKSVERIRELIKGRHDAETAFDEWFRTMILIWHKKREYAKRYDDLKKNFEDTVKLFGRKDADEIRSEIGHLNKTFYPIVGSIKYVNFKENDAMIVEKVPYIITYSEKTHIAVPLITDNEGEIFKNVAQAIVICPYKITYLYDIDSSRAVSKIINTVDFICSMLERKHIKSTINLLFTCRPELCSTASLLSSLTEKHKRIVNVKIIPCEDHEIADTLLDLLSSRICKITAVERNENYKKLFANSKRASEMPSFRFDSYSRTFTFVNGCSFLKYTDTKKYLSVNDIFSTKRSTGKVGRQIDLFKDYGYIFKNLYRKYTRAWKSMCGELFDHAEMSDRIAEFPSYRNGLKAPICSVSYVLPSFTYATINDTVNRLKAYGIISEASAVRFCNTDSVILNIETSESYAKEIKKLISDPARLINQSFISHSPYSSSYRIIINDLKVRRFKPMNYKNDVKCILEDLERQKLIYNLESRSDTDNLEYSFVYASPQVKDMLTKEGAILELYCYSQIAGSRAFNDVVTSYEIDWDGDGKSVEHDLSKTKSEFDLIVTQGFKMLLIECKATVETKQEYYYRIKALKDKFGIQATAVIISDTLEESSDRFKDINTANRNLGDNDGIDVITVYKRDDILNIKDTLCRIFDGTYRS